MELVRTIAVERPVEEVFAYLADFTTTTRWDPGTVRTTRESGDGTVGTRYRNVSKFMGRTVELTYVVEDRDTRWIDRQVTLHGVDEDQRAKLADVAEKTPVTRVVRAGAEIRTSTGAA